MKKLFTLIAIFLQMGLCLSAQDLVEKTGFSSQNWTFTSIVHPLFVYNNVAQFVVPIYSNQKYEFQIYNSELDLEHSFSTDKKKIIKSINIYNFDSGFVTTYGTSILTNEDNLPYFSGLTQTFFNNDELYEFITIDSDDTVNVWNENGVLLASFYAINSHYYAPLFIEWDNNHYFVTGYSHEWFKVNYQESANIEPVNEDKVKVLEQVFSINGEPRNVMEPGFNVVNHGSQKEVIYLK